MKIKYLLLSSVLVVLSFFSVKAQTVVASGDRCSGNDIQYSLLPAPVGIDSIMWHFNDPSAGVDSVSRALRPKHRFNNPGTYTVRVTTYKAGVATNFTAPPLTINASPKTFDFGPDTTICVGQTITLDPYGARNPPQASDAPAPSGVTYLWNTGATTQTIQVDSAGCFSVTVTNAAGCTFTDKITVKVYRQERRDGGRWFFGNNAGINFSSGTATATTGSVNTFEGSSSISDITGRLLFYTDGVTVYDSLGAIMPDTAGVPVTGANGLHGSPVSTQSALIVPQPDDKGCQSLYYIFTTGSVPGGQGLQYSVVDMRLNSGKGAVVEKNVPVVPSTRFPGLNASEKLTAYTSASGQTWVVSHDASGNTFRVFPVTTSGLDLTKVRTFSSITNFTDLQNSSGQMKISPDGTKLAIAIPGGVGQPNYVEIYNFTDSTGVISNPIRIQVGNYPPPLYGVEFSQDGSVLYVTQQGTGSGGTTAADTSSLYQFDVLRMDSTTIARSRVRLDSSNTLIFGALQVASDQQIYMAIQGSSRLSVVQNPSGLGKANAGYTRQSFALASGTTSQLGLPNFVQSFFEPAGGQGFTFRDTCSGGPTSFFAFPDLTGSTFQWNFGDGTTSTLQNPTHTFTTAGIKNIQLTIVNRCTTEVFNQQITILRSPDDFDLGQNIILCPGQTKTLDPYPGQAGPLGAVYTWITPSGPVNTKTITASLPGTYSVQVAVAQCTKSDVITITNSNVTVSLGNDTTFCQGGQKILNAGNPGATYKWFQNGTQLGSTSQTITATTTGQYRVEVTDAVTGCIGRDTINITVTSRAIPTITTTNPTVCGANDGTISISLSPGGSYNFIWTQTQPQLPLSNFKVGAIQDSLFAGVYSVTIQPLPGVNACDTTITGITISDPTGITNVTPAISNVTTCGGNNGQITITVTPANPAYVYTFRNETTGTNFPQSNNPVLSNLTSGTYSVQITLGTCNSFLGNLVITEPVKPTVSINNGSTTVNICQGGTATLTATASDGSTDDTRFTWTRPDNSTAIVRVLSATTAGNYQVIYRNPLTNCSDTTTIAVNVTPLPAVSITQPAAICEGSSVTLTANLTGNTNNLFFDWIFNGNVVATNVTSYTITNAKVANAGTYTFIARSSTTPNCQTSATVNVQINPLPVATLTSNATNICNGSTVTLQAGGGVTGATYTLLPGNITNTTGKFSVTPSATTFYSVTVTNPGNCSSTASTTINVLPQPTVNLGPDRTYCESALQTLDATYPGATSYLWSTNQTTPTIRPSVSGTFWVRVTLGLCVATDTIKVTVTPGIKATAPLKEVPLCLSDPGTPQATVTAGSGTGFTYTWRRAGSSQVLGTQQSLQVSSVGAYVVEIANGTGCTLTDTIRVVEKCDVILQVPQAFTPNNGDALNDNLEIFGTLDRITDFEMIIYNRWGESIFKSTSVTDTWDGKFKGINVPAGSYAWKIKFKIKDYPERGTIVRQGGVLVIR
jgi:gliding motility-associated-like protein